MHRELTGDRLVSLTFKQARSQAHRLMKTDVHPQPLPRRRKTTGYVTACDVEAWRETKLPPSSRLPLFHEVPSGLPLCAAAGCEASRFIRRCIRCYIRRYIRRYNRRYTRCYIRRAATSDEKRKRKKKYTTNCAKRKSASHRQKGQGDGNFMLRRHRSDVVSNIY